MKGVPVWVLCRHCEKWQGNFPDDAPEGCPGCHAKEWIGATEPDVLYKITNNDRRFLRSIRVAVDDSKPKVEG